LSHAEVNQILWDNSRRKGKGHEIPFDPLLTLIWKIGRDRNYINICNSYVQLHAVWLQFTWLWSNMTDGDIDLICILIRSLGQLVKKCYLCPWYTSYSSVTKFNCVVQRRMAQEMI
jgi:hypothetical protein